MLAFDGTGSLTNRYLHGPLVDQILADENLLEDDVFWALSDHLGTVRRLVDNAGNAIRDRIFSAWGQVVEDTNPTFAYPFAFTGREYDPETGLYYYRARYYDPHTGRFLSEDPLSFAAGDTNLSRYVFNSPPNYTDPTGEFIQVLVGAGIGAVVGGVVGGLTGADGWDWDRFWAGAASGALIGCGVGVLWAGAAATGLAATGVAAVSGALMTGGMLSAFGGAMRWGQRGVDWTLWLQHTYWGAVLGAIGGAVFQRTVAIVGTGSAATAAASAPSFAATWYGGLLTYAAAGGLADVSMQMTALVFGLQQTYSPLQTLVAAGSGGLLYGAFRGGAALWTRFRTTPRPGLAPKGKTWQDFLPEAQRRLDATKAKYPGMENATGMAISRAKALERLEGLAPRVEEHLAKIAQNPGHSSIPHWSHEVSNWLNQMEAMLPHVGKKTAADWAAKINQWRQALPPKQ